MTSDLIGQPERCVICGASCIIGEYDGSLPHLYNRFGEQMGEGDLTLFNLDGTLHECDGPGKPPAHEQYARPGDFGEDGAQFSTPESYRARRKQAIRLRCQRAIDANPNASRHTLLMPLLNSYFYKWEMQTVVELMEEFGITGDP